MGRTSSDVQIADNTGAIISPATETTLSSILTALNDYSVQYEEASSTVTYVGFAAPGSSTASAVWRIFRITTTSTTLIKVFADGNRNYDNIWDNRASLSYS